MAFSSGFVDKLIFLQFKTLCQTFYKYIAREKGNQAESSFLFVLTYLDTSLGASQ